MCRAPLSSTLSLSAYFTRVALGPWWAEAVVHAEQKCPSVGSSTDLLGREGAAAVRVSKDSQLCSQPAWWPQSWVEVWTYLGLYLEDASACGVSWALGAGSVLRPIFSH